jgi:hypothetical protein
MENSNQSATRGQRRYRERVAAGVCVDCGKTSPKPGIKRCQPCIDKKDHSKLSASNKKNKALLKQKRIDSGLCAYCGKVRSEDGKNGCKDCNIYRMVHSKKLRERRENNKLCVRCGKDARYQRYKICQECRRKELEAKRRSYVENGLCKTCGVLPIKHEESTLCLRCSNRIHNNRKRRIADNWQKILDHYGRKCACCGEEEVLFLTVDHINNDGALHKKIIGSKDPASVRKWIVDNNFPDTFQILCYNCNCAKGKLGYCPHQMNRTTDLNLECKNPTGE